MLKSGVLHPPLLEALARSGHGSKVLIADGNYPIATSVGSNARVVYLNLERGVLTVDQAAAAVLSLVEVERIQLITPDDHIPTSHGELRAAIPAAFESLSRDDFYREALQPTVSVAIATGDVRLWACLLLTIGVSTAA